MVRSESCDVYGHGMTCRYIYIDIIDIYIDRDIDIDIDRVKYMYVYRLFCIHVQTISLCICKYITYTLIISVGINDFTRTGILLDDVLMDKDNGGCWGITSYWLMAGVSSCW